MSVSGSMGKEHRISKSAGPDHLSHCRGHDDSERDVFPSISSIVLLCTRSLTFLRGLLNYSRKLANSRVTN